MEGIIFTLLSAASFGANNIVVRRGLISMSAGQGLYITVLLGIPLFALAAWGTGQLSNSGDLTSSDLILLAVAGIIHFIAGRYCTFRAVAAIGANRTMPIQALSGFYSVLVAVIFLDEHLSVIIAVGIILVMVGPALIAEGARREQLVTLGAAGGVRLEDDDEGETDIAGSSGSVQFREEKPPPYAESAPPTRLVEGYVFGLLSAVLYGTSPIFIRAALQDTSGLGIVGGLVSYVAAGAVLIVSIVLTRKSRPWASLRKEGRRAQWFVYATVGVFFAQLFRYLALAVAPVSLVVPLTHTRPIFTVVFSYIFNRELESFAPSTMIGIGLSVIGAIAIGIGSL